MPGYLDCVDRNRTLYTGIGDDERRRTEGRLHPAHLRGRAVARTCRHDDGELVHLGGKGRVGLAGWTGRQSDCEDDGSHQRGDYDPDDQLRAATESHSRSLRGSAIPLSDRLERADEVLGILSALRRCDHEVGSVVSYHQFLVCARSLEDPSTSEWVAPDLDAVDTTHLRMTRRQLRVPSPEPTNTRVLGKRSDHPDFAKNPNTLCQPLPSYLARKGEMPSSHLYRTAERGSEAALLNELGRVNT